MPPRPLVLYRHHRHWELLGPAVGDLYRANRPLAAPGDLLAAVLTDRYFRLPALAVAEARAAGPAATYVYEFAWPSPVHGLDFEPAALEYVDLGQGHLVARLA